MIYAGVVCFAARRARAATLMVRLSTPTTLAFTVCAVLAAATVAIFIVFFLFCTQRKSRRTIARCYAPAVAVGTETACAAAVVGAYACVLELCCKNI